MLETSTKIHLGRIYQEHLYSQTSNWSNSIRFIHPSRPKNRVFVKKHRLQLFFVHFYIKPQVAVLRSMFSKCKDKWYIGCKRYKYSIVVKVVSHKDKLSGEDLDATTCKAPDQATKSDSRTSILDQQWNYSILHAFFLTPTTNSVFRPGHMVFSIINHPEEKHNFLGLGQGLGNTVAKLGHHICGSCTQALVPCACCGCCWGGGDNVLPKSGWRVLKHKKGTCVYIYMLHVCNMDFWPLMDLNSECIWINLQT